MLERIIEKSYRKIKSTPMDYIRDLYYEIDWNQRLVGVVWQRGVGKSTLLLQYLSKNYNSTSVYFSADNVNIVAEGLYNTVENLYLKKWIVHFFIDEIHKYQNWNQELKNIYDDFDDIKIAFSGSSSVDLIKWKYDLSRRLTLYRMYGLSFREYLNIVTNNNFWVYTLEEIVNNEEVSRKIYAEIGDKILSHFHEYLKWGYYPFFQESFNKDVYYGKLQWTIDKLIYEDISNFYKIDSLNLEKMRKIIIFYAFAHPGKLSINAIKEKIWLAYDTTANYLEILQEVWILRWINSNGVISKSIRKAKKIFIDNTNIVYAMSNETGYNIEIGTIREIFFINNFKKNIFFSDIGDFYIKQWEKEYIFEIGGKNKTRKQLKWIQNGYIVSDDIIFSSDKKIPLWIFGFVK